MVCGIIDSDECLISYFNTDNYDICYGVLNRKSGEVLPLGLSTGQVPCTSGGNIIINDYSSFTISIFDPELPDVKKVLAAPSGTELIAPAENSENLYFYSSSGDGEGNVILKLYSYNIESCRLTAEMETELPGEYMFIQSADEYNGVVLLEAVSDTSSRIIIWEPENIGSQHGYTAISGADYSTANIALAQKISEKYSIDVYYGKEGVRHFDNYAVVSETDEKLINNALTALDGFFGKFPTGFFDELTSKTVEYDTIKIYLTGQIVPDLSDKESISDAAAFVTAEYNEQLMVLDITMTDLEKTAAHEFMHIIENAMFDMYYDENGEWRDLEQFRRWDMLNPEGFSYYYTYTDDNGSTLGYDAVDYNGAMYYDGSGIDINTIYFVDGYSMTYPNEDRARIFENIATCSAATLPAYFNGSAMQLKSAYLCACIRECFDCITDDTVLFWENSVNPEYTLDYFRENYDIEAYWEGVAAG